MAYLAEASKVVYSVKDGIRGKVCDALEMLVAKGSHIPERRDRNFL